MLGQVGSGLAQLVVPALVGQSSTGSFWLPPPDSVASGAVDHAFHFVMYVSYFFFALIFGLIVLFVVKYRRWPGAEAVKTAKSSLALEATWSLIPLALTIVMFYLGFVGYVELRSPPERAYEISVLARKWSWQFTYPDGTIDNNLHVPVGEPVRLVMTSDDVIHSLSIPAFRVKMDVVPGHYTRTWFQGKELGTYDLYCTEYCGTGHSDMLASVVVHEADDFRAWLKAAGDVLGNNPPAKAGEILFRRHGCGSCHSTDGTPRRPVAPGHRRPDARNGRRQQRRGRRKLHPPVDPRAGDENPPGIQEPDADLQGAAERPGNHRDHPVHQVAELASAAGNR